MPIASIITIHPLISSWFKSSGIAVNLIAFFLLSYIALIQDCFQLPMHWPHDSFNLNVICTQYRLLSYLSRPSVVKINVWIKQDILFQKNCANLLICILKLFFSGNPKWDILSVSWYMQYKRGIGQILWRSSLPNICLSCIQCSHFV